jgi:hypothetical protein
MRELIRVVGRDNFVHIFFGHQAHTVE